MKTTKFIVAVLFSFTFLFLIASSNSLLVKAECSNPPNGCQVGCTCDRHGGTIYPEVGLNPSSDPNANNNCVSLSSHTNYGVENVGTFGGYPLTAVTANYGLRFYYCAQNTQITANRGGEVVIYSKTGYIRVLNPAGAVVWQAYAPAEGTGFLTGMTLTAGQRFTVNTGEYNYTDGIGWRRYNNESNFLTFFTNARNNATANGYIIISEQYWADALTQSKYDSYDFNDLAIVVAIKPPAVPPTCDENRVTLNSWAVDEPSGYLYLSERVGLAVNQGLNPALYRNPSNSFSPAIGFTEGVCSPSQNSSRVCTINNKVNAGTVTVRWTHNWQNCLVANPAVCSSCSTYRDFTVLPYPGALTTTGGTLYVRNQINEIRLNRFPGLSLAKYTLGSALAKSTAVPQEDAFLSSTGKFLFSYNDANTSTNFYDELAPDLRTQENITIKRAYSGTTVYLDQLAFDTFAADGVQLVDVTGSLSLTGITCKSKTIFLVSVNLVINPNFFVNANNGCLFVVRGSTTITEPVAGTNYVVNAFVITNSLTTSYGTGNLTLKGGFITNSSYFYRNINRNKTLASGIVRNASESIIYEGARYYYHFKKYLSSPINVEIKEN